MRSGAAPPELILYAGYVACNGHGEAEGWDELLTAPDLRAALVCAIVWRAIKENVIEELMFGANGTRKERLEGMEREMLGDDGKSCIISS